jgi:hypothetical protein
MPTTISPLEYEQRLVPLAETLRQRFPDIRISVEPTTIWLNTRTCGGQITLRFTLEELIQMYVACEFSSGMALSGSLKEVKIGICDYQRVYDALEFAAQEFADVIVVREGKPS